MLPSTPVNICIICHREQCYIHIITCIHGCVFKHLISFKTLNYQLVWYQTCMLSRISEFSWIRKVENGGRGVLLVYLPKHAPNCVRMTILFCCFSWNYNIWNNEILEFICKKNCSITKLKLSIHWKSIIIFFIEFKSFEFF